MNHEQTSKPQNDAVPATPVIAWEQAVDRTPETPGSNVISIDSYRRQGTLPNESEATFTVREFQTTHGEEPIRLIMVSSGFGQKRTVHSHTVQSKAS
ncbi:hypothetical protein [Paenibacillus sp. Soil724D2]|uniref:hypothetical protein n=1 Tax=Paenibacillus sp. (strain Soil724D2) TaxID=1736392 RepID=UPI0007155545|nr:hypothetical protein [Paenibacillus sp. Soil724D2]KRE32936.1 hypothetical protein ASG85_15625 [Paenibacillus sp. Soil724D2]